jgi:hypothetical protein
MTVRQSSNGSYRTFVSVNADTGTILSGTWRQRGIISTSAINQGAINNGTSQFFGEALPVILCQRSA